MFNFANVLPTEKKMAAKFIVALLLVSLAFAQSEEQFSQLEVSIFVIYSGHFFFPL